MGAEYRPKDIATLIDYAILTEGEEVDFHRDVRPVVRRAVNLKMIPHNVHVATITWDSRAFFLVIELRNEVILATPYESGDVPLAGETTADQIVSLLGEITRRMNRAIENYQNADPEKI